ncbi:DUF2194 domain-containing protein [Niallia sp. 01092]|uniref:DUF2194 domain-containing protein n=1 Tax=unclassified Niallia TaxID=2837522 RepID=UPI003FD24397
MLKIKPNFVWIIAAILVAIISLVLFFRSDALYQIFSFEQSVSEKKFKTYRSENKIGKGQSLRLYVISAETTMGKQVQENLIRAMDYGHIHFESIRPDQISSITSDPYTGIIFSGEMSNKVNREDLEKFVRDGGRLIVPYRFFTDPSWDPLFGITQKQDFKEVKGIHFEKSLFPGYPDIPASSKLFTHNALNVSLNPATTNIWMTAEDLPILWKNDYGDGKVLYWNTTVMDDKLGRGLFVQSLGLVFPSFASAQLDVQIMYIDDFPAPIPNGRLNNVTKKAVSLPSFYQNFWWKDMKKIADDYDFKYTGVAIGTYQNMVKPPFPSLIEERRNTYLFFGWELFSKGGEVGFHGFNHQPLLTKEDPVNKEFGYVSWNRQKDMEESLIELYTLLHHFYPNNKLETYVPPSNVVNRTGLNAISRALPEVKTIAALYFGSNANSTLVTEFEYDHMNRDIYFFPRITSGYELSADDQFLLADVVANFGVVSHFVHPDDILDSERSGNKTWNELADAYRQITANVRKWYPHIEGVTQIEATELIKKYQKGELVTSYEQDRIHIAYKGLPAQASVVIRIEDGKYLKTGTFSFGSVTKLDNQLYSVKLLKPQAEIPIKGEAL